MLLYLIAAVIGVSILLIIIFILLYNRLKALQVKVAEAAAGIDVALEKRFDVLTAQAEAVKRYLQHERQTLLDTVHIRAQTDYHMQKQQVAQSTLQAIEQQLEWQTRNLHKIKSQMQKTPRYANQKQNTKNMYHGLAGQSQSIGMLQQMHHDMEHVGAGFQALAEQYPTLQSWISMDRLQQSITDTEEHLQAARRLYNANVSQYNQTIVSVPWVLVASLFHMKHADFYETEPKKRNIPLHLS